MSSEAGSGIDLLKILERNSFFKDASSWKLNFIETGSNVIGARNDKNQVSGLLSLLAQSSLSNTAGLQSASIKGLVEGIEKSAGLENSLKEKLKSISSEAEGNAPKAIQDLIELYAK